METLREELRRLEEQERLLQFPKFSADDAWTLGCMLVENAKKRALQPAFEITLNGYTVFRYGFGATNPHNAQWLRRKQNTVQVTHMSSLRAGLLLETSGEDPEKDWHLPPADYAFLGGGFPLTLRGTGVVGAICCSGLPHRTDHQIVTDTVAAYLGISLEGQEEKQ